MLAWLLYFKERSTVAVPETIERVAKDYCHSEELCLRGEREYKLHRMLDIA